MNLSIVVPAYNEEDRIVETLERYCTYFPKRAKKFELIVVVNGSHDRTLEYVSAFRIKHAFVRIINIPHKVGKGGALIAGLKMAQYDVIGFLDADDAFELEDISPILRSIDEKKIDAGIASKWKSQSFGTVDEPFTRKVLSRVWNMLARLFLNLKFRDTQAGAKFFAKSAWDCIPKDFIGKGFEFDVDLLSRLNNRGLRIREFYVRNRHKEQSKFKLAHSIGMFIRLFRIALHKKEQHPAYYYRTYKNWWYLTHIFYRKKIDWILSFIPPKSTFLDAGCGSGALPLIAAAKKGCTVTGVDIKKDQVMFAQRLCPQGTFVQQDIRKLSLKKKFQVVNCSDVIEHFEKEERENILARLGNHVQSNGRLILVFPSWFYISIFEKFWKTLRRILSPSTHFDDDDIHRVVPPQDIIHFYTKKKYGVIKNGTFGFGLLEYVVFKK